MAECCCSDNGLTRPASDQVLPLGLLVRHVGDQAFTTSSEISLQHRFFLGAILSYEFLLTFRFRCSASGGCVFEREISKGNNDRLFYFTASNATFSYEISPESAGLSVIMFANCYNNYVGVSYTVSLDIENPGGVRVSAGTRRPFRSATVSSDPDAGDAALPSVFLVFACFMAAAAVRWAREISRNAAHVVGIHRVMAALVVVKSVWLAVASFHWYVPSRGTCRVVPCGRFACSLTLLLLLRDEAAGRYWLKWTGSSSWWTFLMYIVQFIDGMVMFAVILLIGTGWSFLKPYLHPREKRLLMTVLPMQVRHHVCTPTQT
jgi:hypothetical protein